MSDLEGLGTHAEKVRRSLGEFVAKQYPEATLELAYHSSFNGPVDGLPRHRLSASFKRRPKDRKITCAIVIVDADTGDILSWREGFKWAGHERDWLGRRR